MRALPWICLLVLAGSAAGCQGAATQPGAPPAPISLAATEFSGDKAFAHLQALSAIGPRVAGTPGAAQARVYLKAELEKLGLTVEDVRIEAPPGPDGVTRELVNLVAVIPGASKQRIVLAAPYDTRRFESFKFVGANDGASAPALLLEIARVLTAAQPRYTTWIVFLDGEAPSQAGAEADAEPELAGSRALVIQLARDGGGVVRLAVLFQQVGDSDLKIARDLRSHRLFREEFWLAAARLGKTEAFAPGEPFETPAGSHLPFLAAGYRGVVLLTDPSYGGKEPPGAYANSEDDTPERCSPASLASVGSVTLEALDQIGARLAKIDRLAKPVASSEPSPGEPAPPSDEPSPPPGETTDAQAPPSPPAPAEAPAAEPAPTPVPAPPEPQAVPEPPQATEAAPPAR